VGSALGCVVAVLLGLVTLAGQVGASASAPMRSSAGSASRPTLAYNDPVSFGVRQVHGLTTRPSPEARHMARMSALSPDSPHTQTLTSVRTAESHPVRNGVTSSALASANWSGLIDNGPGASFTEIQGDWTVPAVVSSAGDEASGTWIGIDGVSTSSLIQTGTAQNTGPDFGGNQYLAWVELLPGTEEPIGNSSELAPVEPGDTMQASILEGSTDVWTIALNDVTQDWSFSQQFSYSTPGTTAEWIEEAPTVNGSVSTLADYGSTTFTNLGVGGTDVSAAVTTPVVLEAASGAIVSYPSDLNSSGTSFSLFYGSPPPQVTWVIPDQGTTSGGTLVQIGGDFVTGVSAVYVDGVPVPFSANFLAGSVTVTTPPHSPGTVDITVTTPGGTSQPSTSDQFTYATPGPAEPLPPPAPPITPTVSVTTTPALAHGYWLVGSDGGIFTFGSAQFYGSTGSLRLQRPVVGIVPTGDRGGYWLDASDGGVFAFGDSGFYGSIPGLGLHPAGSGLPHSLNAPIVGMVPSSDGGGYFMVASDGGVFAFGDARFAGSCPGIGGCAGAAVAVMPDASGNGYWLVTQSGSVYAFGDAPYFGQPGKQNVPVTSAVRTPDGHGYWILFANGAISHYGDAASYGSPIGQFGGLNPANSIFATSDGGGYWLASANGTVDNFGDAPNDGSMAGTALNGSIVAATGW
jgi:hypothetical protein